MLSLSQPQNASQNAWGARGFDPGDCAAWGVWCAARRIGVSHKGNGRDPRPRVAGVFVEILLPVLHQMYPDLQFVMRGNHKSANIYLG